MLHPTFYSILYFIPFHISFHPSPFMKFGVISVKLIWSSLFRGRCHILRATLPQYHYCYVSSPVPFSLCIKWVHLFSLQNKHTSLAMKKSIAAQVRINIRRNPEFRLTQTGSRQLSVTDTPDCYHRLYVWENDCGSRNTRSQVHEAKSVNGKEKRLL